MASDLFFIRIKNSGSIRAESKTGDSLTTSFRFGCNATIVVSDPFSFSLESLPDLSSFKLFYRIYKGRVHKI